MIAANGLLLLHQILLGQGDNSVFLSEALRIARDTVNLSLAHPQAVFKRTGNALVVEDGPIEGRFDAILRNATACRNEDSLRQYWDHGLVYADYYFLEFGNKLIRMGLL